MALVNDAQGNFLMIAALSTSKELAGMLGEPEKLKKKLKDDYEFPDDYLADPQTGALLNKLGNTNKFQAMFLHSAELLTAEDGPYADTKVHAATLKSIVKK